MRLGQSITAKGPPAVRRHRKVSTLRGPALVTIVVNHPIQYFSPLFDELKRRNVISSNVVYGSDAGLRSAFDPGFGQEIAWDLDLVGGHPHEFLLNSRRFSLLARSGSYLKMLRRLARSEVVVVHGYATREAILAILVCLVLRVPYLLRSDTSILRLRSHIDVRGWWVWIASRFSAGALTSGLRNAEVHKSSGVRRIFPAPFTVDTSRFAKVINPENKRATKASLGIPPGAFVAIFLGKLTEGKRPQDLADAMMLTESRVHAVFIGDGPLMQSLKNHPAQDRMTLLGFRNQLELPELLSLGDVIVLPSRYEAWGLAVNEGLAAGLVPVVSESVGCAPDLVEGVGRVYKTGDIRALAVAIDAACSIRKSEQFRTARERFMAEYSMSAAARAYESAVLELSASR